MRYGLNDHTVKRIAAIAHHSKGTMINNLFNIYNSISHPDTINKIANAHTLDAMNHKFANKEEENIFKRHLATAAAVNRGTLQVISTPKSPKGEGLEPNN